MHLVYVDEVKHDPPRRLHFWLCALACPEASILGLESRLRAIAEEYFGNATLPQDTEFHAREILWGKGQYRGTALVKRLDLYKELIDAIDETEGLCRIQIRIDPSHVIAATYADKAFMFLVEKVDSLMAAKKSLALLISDEDHEVASDNVASLSVFKSRGTDYVFGRSISRVVDTIHYTKSHHSRMLQLADVYAHTCSLVAGDCSKEPKKTIEAYARTKQNVLFPTKYKHWPTQFSWYASA
jgi:hypothetical protein